MVAQWSSTKLLILRSRLRNQLLFGDREKWQRKKVNKGDELGFFKFGLAANPLGTLSRGLYYKCFAIVIYDCKGTLQFAAYVTIVIYAPSYGQVSQDRSFTIQAPVACIVKITDL